MRHEGAPSDARGQTRLNQTSQGSNPGQPGATSGRPGAENSQTPPSGQGSGEQGRPGQPNGPGDPQGQPKGQSGNEAEQPGGQGSGTVPEGQRGDGGAGRTPYGGGGNRPGPPGGPAAPDTSKPSPRAESRPVNSEETIAPDIPQSDLVLRKLEDLLRSDQVTPKLEQETGMSREQMEQFVQKFKKAPKATPGPGREIKAKPEPVRTFDPNRKLPDLNPNAKIGSRTIRDRNSFVQDQEHNNLQGPLFEAPSELRSKFDAYRSSLSRSKVATPTRSAPAGGGR
ncbi:MAG: hypothetical protein JO034_14900 [Singulisphaera sp.]|nr:hypothetical protein [Singulisphaera sp.]